MEGNSTEQRLVGCDLKSEDEVVRVETPLDIQAMRTENLPLARDWRFKTREVFETYFARGYVAVDFSREANCNLYTLWRPPSAWLGALTQ